MCVHVLYFHCVVFVFVLMVLSIFETHTSTHTCTQFCQYLVQENLEKEQRPKPSVSAEVNVMTIADLMVANDCLYW